MDADESMADYVARVVSLTEGLKDMKQEQQPAMIIAKILSSLPAKYDNDRMITLCLKQ